MVEVEKPGDSGIGYSKRDGAVKQQEEDGNIYFKTYKNDKTLESMKKLIELKTIISKQLPRMPKHYIVKLIMDRHHESLCLIKRAPPGGKDTIIGGCVFRPFRDQKFYEIAFLAIITNEQVRGYGTRLMNRLKDLAQADGIEYFMTYADNNAIEYFKKQGFQKQIRMPASRWKGYIKDYSVSTHMECFINPTIDFIQISSILNSQKQTLQDAVLLASNALKYPPLDFSQRRPLGFEDVPGLAEAGWTEQDYKNAKEGEEKTFEQGVKDILKKLDQHENAWPFKDPVDVNKVPDYHLVVKTPMDLKKVNQKHAQGAYATREDFKRDILLIFENAKSYNAKETIYYKYADQLQREVGPMLARLKEKD